MSASVRLNVYEEAEELKAKLWGSFLLFCQTFFPLVTGRQFIISNPPGRESHFITIAKDLTSVFRMQLTNLSINVPPGHGKSVLLSMWVAWTLSRYPDSQYLYISYGHELAAKHTDFIKRIISVSHYRTLFGVELRQDSRAKDYFQTTAGGSIKAFGSSGAVVGQDAGFPGCDRFSGAVICDDLHKVDEAHSDTKREGVIQNYRETILQRPRSPNVPIIFIGQRVHEEDIFAHLLGGNDERVWKSVILKAIDDTGNPLYPEVNPLPQLLEKKEKSPYVFSAQFQQEPIPPGGALYRESYFPILDEEPEILATFITADSAETEKTFNDATVFSFWGIHKIKYEGMETGQIGLVWLDCWELRIEPKDLKGNFLDFYQSCMMHKVKPLVAYIEKKSTGVTLLSVLADMPGLQVIDVQRTVLSGSKGHRHIELQTPIASKQVSFIYGAKHIKLCISHMKKITASGLHRFDDICDTAYDACKVVLIDKSFVLPELKQAQDKTLREISRKVSNLNSRRQDYWR